MGSVKTPLAPSPSRYDCLVQDVLFVVIVAAFFAGAALLVIGCERILSKDSERSEP